ncbi:MAG: hypothetical protein ABJ349_20065 [Hyphomicrobiales bacterium]
MNIHVKNRTLLQASVGVGALLLSSGAFAAGEGPTIVDRWISESKEYSFVDLSYQGLSYDEASDVTEVTGFKIVLAPDFSGMMPEGEESPKITYTFIAPTLRYTGLSEDNNRYSAALIDAPEVNFNLTMKGGPEELDLEQGNSSGKYERISVRDADWAKLPEIIDDPKKPITKYYPLLVALSDGGFSSMKIEGTRTMQTIDKSTNMEAVYGLMEIGEVKAGDYSTLSIDGMEMSSVRSASAEPASEFDNFTVTIGRIEASDYNSGTAIRQLDPALPLSKRDTPFETLVGRVAALDIEVKVDDEASVKFDEVSYSDWGMRPPSIPMFDMIDAMYLKAQESDQDPDEKEVIELVASLYAMFRIGSFDINGLGLQFEEGDGPVSASLESFRLADLWSAGLGEFSIKGLDVETQGNKVKSDIFQIRDIGFPTLAALMDAERASDEQDIAGIIAALPTLGLIELAGIEFVLEDGPDSKLGLSRLEMGNFINRLPTKVSATLDDLQMNVSDLDPAARAEFEKLGYERVNISYVLSLLWDEASEILSASSNASLVDGGKLNADVEIGGVPRSVFENPETAQNAIAFLTFNAASVIFDDNSLVNRALTSIASEQGKEPEQLRQELVGALPFVMGALNKPEFVSEVSAAVLKLLQEGGSLTATAKPGAPVSVMQVIAGGATAPGTLVDLLEVEVIAE